MISFNTIPISIRRPGQWIEFDSSRAVSGLPQIRNRVLLIGQRLASGSAAAATVQPVFSASQAAGLFGRGSMLARMVAAYKKADRYSEVHAIALDDIGGGTAASGTITVTGPATASGVIALMVAGVRIEVPVAVADSANTLAARIAATINALPDLPVTAAAVAAVVTVTCRHKGTCGNSIWLSHSHFPGEALPAGIGLAVVAMAGGASDPDIDAVWPVIGDNPYRTIVLGFAEATTLAKVNTELDDRWGADRMLEGVAFAGRAGTQGALAAFGAAHNGKPISTLGGGKSPTWPSEAAAIMAAACSYYSAIDPARPLDTLELVGMVAPKEEDRFTSAEREALLHDGISTYTVEADGTCLIERAISMYQTDAQNIDDEAWLALEPIYILQYLRVSTRVRTGTKWPRHGLADDDTHYGPGRKIVTPKVIRAELIALAREWELAGLVENVDQFIADLIVERDANDRDRVNALIPPDLVNQFRRFAAAVQFRL